MAENNFEASVGLKVDTASIDKAIKQVSTKLETGFAKADGKLSQKLSKQIDRDLNRLGKQLERSSEAASRILERGLKVGLGLGTSAVYAFLKNGSPAAERFAVSLSNIKTAWGKVGQTLATKIKFGGATGQEWADRFADRLEKLDTSQIEKALGYIKTMATLWVGFKAISIGIKGGEMIGSITKLISDVKAKFSQPKSVSDVLPQNSNTIGNAAAGSALLLSRVNKRIFDKWSQVKALPMNDNVKSMYDQAKANNSDTLRVGSTRFPMDKVSKVFGDAPMTTWDRMISSKVGSALSNQPKWLDKLSPYRTGFVNRGLSGVEIGASAANNLNNIANGGSISQGIGKTGAVVLGTLIGGPIGGAIASGIAEGVDLLTKGIAKAFEKSVDYYDKKLESNRGALWNSSAKQSEDDMAQAARKVREKLFEGQTNNAIFALRKSSVYSNYLNEQNAQYPSGQMPAFKLKTTNVVANVAEKINTLSMIEKNMLDTYETFTDMEKTTNTEFKAQLDAISAEKNFYIGEQNKQISIWKDAKEKQKAFNESIKEFDRQVIDARTKYENTLTDINKDPNAYKSLQSSISMGGDISSIPAIISQGLNDQKNKQSETINENFQKMIDTELALLEYQMELVNIAADEQKAREEKAKADKEANKATAEYQKEMLEETKITNSTLGGSAGVKYF